MPIFGGSKKGVEIYGGRVRATAVYVGSKKVWPSDPLETWELAGFDGQAVSWKLIDVYESVTGYSVGRSNVALEIPSGYYGTTYRDGSNYQYVGSQQAYTFGLPPGYRLYLWKY